MNGKQFNSIYRKAVKNYDHDRTSPLWPLQSVTIRSHHRERQYYSQGAFHQQLVKVIFDRLLVITVKYIVVFPLFLPV